MITLQQEKDILIENIKEAEMWPYSRATSSQVDGWKARVNKIEIKERR